MNYKRLGLTELVVSQLCFGSLTLGPLQKNFSPREGGAVIKAAIARGVNFIDTAELYQNYQHIKEGCHGEKEIILSSKSYAYTYHDMRTSVENACRQTGRDYIDIFGLHEQSSRLTLKGHQDALHCLVDAKKEGLVRAIAVSTHFVEVVRAAAMLDEVDVIHPILNQKGLGIADGSVEDMLCAIDFASYMGKGIYAMKALGGGHLSGQSQEVLRWVLDVPGIASIAVGMRDSNEVQVNCDIFSGDIPAVDVMEKVQSVRRNIFVEEYCTGCGNCSLACTFSAIAIVDGKAVIDRQKCIGCAYCAARCEHFCIKVV